MKFLLLMSLFIISACTFTVQDTRTPAEASATRTARPLPPLYEPVLRIVLERPPVTIEPHVGVPDWNYVVTPTPTKVSE